METIKDALINPYQIVRWDVMNLFTKIPTDEAIRDARQVRNQISLSKST